VASSQSGLDCFLAPRRTVPPIHPDKVRCATGDTRANVDVDFAGVTGDAPICKERIGDLNWLPTSLVHLLLRELDATETAS